MKYPHGFGVTIPYIDTNTDGTTSMVRALVHTNDSIDRRAIKKVIRKWVKITLGRTLQNVELLMLMKNVRKHTQAMQYMRMPDVK